MNKLSTRLKIASLSALVLALISFGYFLKQRGSDTKRSETNKDTSSLNAPHVADPAKAESDEAKRSALIDVYSEGGQAIDNARVEIVGEKNQARGLSDESGLAELKIDFAPILLKVEAAGFKSFKLTSPQVPDEGDFSWTVTLSAEENEDGLQKLVVRCEGKTQIDANLVGLNAQKRVVVEGRSDERGEVSLNPEGVSRWHVFTNTCNADEKKANPSLEPIVFNLKEGGRFAVSAKYKNEAITDFSVLVQRKKREIDVRKDRRTYKVLYRRTANRARFESSDMPKEKSRYLTPALSQGEYDVTLNAPGFEPQRRVAKSLSEALTTLDFSLERAATLTGHVVDEKGNPLKNVRISTRAKIRDKGFAKSRSDAEGNFKIATQAKLRHTLMFSSRGYAAKNIPGIELDADEERDLGEIVLRKLKEGEPSTTQYTGIGAVLKVDEQGVRIQKTLPGGSASDVLGQDDRIVQVDGEWIQGLSLMEVVEKIVGESDTEVELLVESIKTGERRSEVLARKEIDHVQKKRTHRGKKR